MLVSGRVTPPQKTDQNTKTTSSSGVRFSSASRDSGFRISPSQSPKASNNLLGHPARSALVGVKHEVFGCGCFFSRKTHVFELLKFNFKWLHSRIALLMEGGSRHLLNHQMTEGDTATYNCLLYVGFLQGTYYKYMINMEIMEINVKIILDAVRGSKHSQWLLYILAPYFFLFQTL